MRAGVTAVAKKKAKGKPAPTPGERPIAIAVRARPEWKNWVEQLRDFTAKKLGIPISLNTLVGLALASYAKSIGFKVEPPER